MTAWEALLGARPFPDDQPQRDEAIRRGLFNVPAGRTIPRSLERALRSGLAADPERRPDSMEPLLRALEASVSARWRRPVATLGAIAAAGAVGLMVSAPPEAPVATEAPCEAPADGLAARWGEGVLGQIERALPDDEGDTALAWAQAKPLLEARRAALDVELVDVCRAERRGATDPKAARGQRLCLLGQRERFRLLLDHVATGNLSAMPLLLRSLPPSPCSEGLKITSRAPLSFDEEEQLLLSLIRLETELKLGLGDPAEARALMARAEALGAHAYRAHAALQLALRAPEPAQEIAQLREVLRLAEELDDPMLVAQAASVLSISIETDEAAELVGRARDAADAMTTSKLKAKTDVLVNIVEAAQAHAQGQLDDALRHAERALEGSRRHDPETTRVALTLQAQIASQMGRLDDALDSQRALLHWSSRYMTSALERVSAQLAIATTLRRLGRLTDAWASIDRALSLSEQHVEQTSPYRELVWGEAVSIAVAQGDLERAESLSRQVPSALLSNDGPDTRELLQGHAELLLAQQRFHALLDGLHRVQARSSSAEDPHRQAMLALFEAEALRRTHRPRAALELAERAHPVVAHAAPNDPQTARASCTLAWLLADDDQLERAHALFDEAARTLHSPALRSWAEFGRAVTEPERSPAAVRSAAREARAQLEPYAASYRYELDQIDAWLESPS